MSKRTLPSAKQGSEWRLQMKESGYFLASEVTSNESIHQEERILPGFRASFVQYAVEKLPGCLSTIGRQTCSKVVLLSNQVFPAKKLGFSQDGLWVWVVMVHILSWSYICWFTSIFHKRFIQFEPGSAINYRLHVQNKTAFYFSNLPVGNVPYM